VFWTRFSHYGIVWQRDSGRQGSQERLPNLRGELQGWIRRMNNARIGRVYLHREDWSCPAAGIVKTLKTFRFSKKGNTTLFTL
jgi:hypothetical protein